jgi:hypothetical protein
VRDFPRFLGGRGPNGADGVRRAEDDCEEDTGGAGRCTRRLARSANNRLPAWEISQARTSCSTTWWLIEELTRWRRDVSHPRESLRRELEEPGDDAARHFQQAVAEVTGRYKHMMVITHVPPFREATWHQQQIGDDNWLPHFSCKTA